MTERALLVKFATSNDYAAIGVEAPSAIRVFRVSDASLLYTASAIPPAELSSSSGNIHNDDGFHHLSLHSHSSVNEALTAIALTPPSSSQQQQKQSLDNDDDDVSNNNNDNFTCNLAMGTSAGRVSLFDCVAGRLRWSRFVPDGSNVAVRAVAQFGNFVFAATARHTLSIFDAATGRIIYNGGHFGSSASAQTVELGNCKAMSACSNSSGNNQEEVMLFVGGLQPLVYRLSGVAAANTQSQQQQQMLEPFSHCRVQPAPCDHVSICSAKTSSSGNNINNSNSVLLGATSCYSEGIVRIWNLQRGAAICIQSCDIAAAASGSALSSALAGGGSSAVAAAAQRFSNVSVDLYSGRVAASTVAGSLFLWTCWPQQNNSSTNNALVIPAREALTQLAPTATLVSPSVTLDIITASSSSSKRNRGNSNNSNINNAESQQAYRNGRIVAAFFSKTGVVSVLRRNWSAPIFQPWLWSELVPSSTASPSSTSITPAMTTASTNEVRVLPVALSRGEVSSQQDQQQQKRTVHLPQSVGKKSTSSALKGLDLPTAGAFAFPKVTLFHAKDMSQLPSSSSGGAARTTTTSRTADDDEDENEKAAAAQQEEAEKLAAATTTATASSLIARRRAGVTPALYQALHADDTSLVMEILSAGGRTASDREATVLALEIDYIVQLVHLLSQRLLLEGAKSPLHVWVSTIMKLRGRELFAMSQLAEQEQEQQQDEINNSSKKVVNKAKSLRAALLPLLEHYRSILASVGSKVAFAAGRSSIFKSVKRRTASNVNAKRRSAGGRNINASILQQAPRFIDAQRGVVMKSRGLGDEDEGGDDETGEQQQEDPRLLTRLQRRRRAKAERRRRELEMMAGAEGDFVDEHGADDDMLGFSDNDDEDDDYNAEEAAADAQLGYHKSAATGARGKFRAAPDRDVDSDIDDEIDEEDDDDNDDGIDFDEDELAALQAAQDEDDDEEENSDLEDDVDDDDDGQQQLLQDDDADEAEEEEDDDEIVYDDDEKPNKGSDDDDDDDADADEAYDLDRHERTVAERAKESRGPRLNKQVDFD